MNIQRNILLRYLLIILMMFAPVRSVMAIQQSHCDMDTEVMSEMMHEAMQSSLSVQNMSEHDMSAMSFESVTNQNSNMNHDCCCCETGCADNCEMSMGASLVMQSTSYGPVYKTLSESKVISSNLLSGFLATPSRPPARLFN